MFTVTARCGWCKELGEFQFRHAFGFSAIDPEAGKGRKGGIMPVDRTPGSPSRAHAEPEVEAAAISQCIRCYKPSMIVFSARPDHLDSIIECLDQTAPLKGGASLVTVSGMYPPQPETDDDPHWPAEIRREFRDAQTMLMSNVSPSIIMVACRTILDVVMRKLGASEGTLHQRINLLQARAVITTPLADWAHKLRLDGNEAVDEAKGERDEAAEFVEFLRTLMNVTFSLPAKIARQQGRST